MAKILLAALLSCGAVTAPAQASAGPKVKIGGFDFTPPSAWKQVPAPGSIRKAQFRVPNPADEPDGVVIFYHFGPGKGGSPDANIARWRAHFPDPSQSASAKVTILRKRPNNVYMFEGFGGLDAGGGRTLPDYGLLAGILRSAQGDVFIRFTGPARLVRNVSGAFRRLLLSPFSINPRPD